ncbi:MAG: FAD-dependent oxidoreductase [Acidobacteria bacterium]|nr:MAG: FAD-dependent oxidoreductase [Acidobacteriota bacterium]
MFGVIVVGAGAAGLAAFQKLREAGCDALLLEARERVGGRIWTIKPHGWPAPVELGAEFIHGGVTEPEAAATAEGQDWSVVDGELVPVGQLAEGADEVSKRLEAARGPDQSFAEFLNDHCRDLPEEARTRALAFIEGYEAADPARISVTSLQREFAADGEWGQPRRPRGGYSQWLGRLHAAGEIQLASPVRRIAWGPGSVVVATPAQEIAARAAIITLPLSILQRNEVTFVPPLTSKRAALEALAMGGAVRAVLRLESRIWRDIRGATGGSLADLRFLFGGPGAFPTWWKDPHAEQITGWAGGPHAAALAGMTQTEIGARALDSLAGLLRVSRRFLDRNLIEVHTHDWQADPWSRGAYSYACVGGADAHAALAQPLSQSLFFAGEATDNSGHHATVGGAVASGQRAAAEVLGAI